MHEFLVVSKIGLMRKCANSVSCNKSFQRENEKQTHYSGIALEIYNKLLVEAEEAKSSVKKTPV